jgi:phosphate acetyltransferase
LTLRDRGVEVLSVIANKVEDENREIIITELQRNFFIKLLSRHTAQPILANPSIKEL